jgi:hypothetical protein
VIAENAVAMEKVERFEPLHPRHTKAPLRRAFVVLGF